MLCGLLQKDMPRQQHRPAEAARQCTRMHRWQYCAPAVAQSEQQHRRMEWACQAWQLLAAQTRGCAQAQGHLNATLALCSCCHGRRAAGHLSAVYGDATRSQRDHLLLLLLRPVPDQAQLLRAGTHQRSRCSSMQRPRRERTRIRDVAFRCGSLQIGLIDWAGLHRFACTWCRE
jgi:hypothetical protein